MQGRLFNADNVWLHAAARALPSFLTGSKGNQLLIGRCVQGGWRAAAEVALVMWCT